MIHDLRLSLQYGGIANSFPRRPTRYESLKLSNFWFLKKPPRSKEGVDDGLYSLIASNWKTCDREVKAYTTKVARIVNKHRDKTIKNKMHAERFIQKIQTNPSFQNKVKPKNGWVDGFYGVQLETVPSSALPYFQSYLKSRTTPCDSITPSMAAFNSGPTFSQQTIPSTEAGNTFGLRANNKSSHTTDKASLKRETETTTTKAVSESFHFGFLPPTRYPGASTAPILPQTIHDQRSRVKENHASQTRKK
eukprot:scaffold18312_cov77-Cyclotella_meneghiniana.AAC.3